MKLKDAKLVQMINKMKARTDIEKDIKNPVRRVYRHTILKSKYGDMQKYHSDACHYYTRKESLVINEVAEESRKKMQEDLEAIWAKEAEKAQKKAEREAQREAAKAEREAAKAAKKAQKDLSDEVLKMAEENTEALQNIVDELHEINKEAEEDFREVKSEATEEQQQKAVNGVGTADDLINNNPNITKGEDGLYHFTPVIFHDEDPKTEAAEEEAKIEEPVKEEAPKTKAKKEPKVPQDRKKPAAKKSTKSSNKAMK